MLAVSRDSAWVARLQAMASRGGWPFQACADTSAGGAVVEPTMVLLDKAAAVGGAARAVAALRAQHPTAIVALVCAESDMGAEGISEAISSGADGVLSKSWDDGRITARLSTLRDVALSVDVRRSTDGALKAERRSHRAYARVAEQWIDLRLPTAEFALLWRLMEKEGGLVSRGELLDFLSSSLGLDLEPGTVSRRVLSLRRSLARWKGSIESVRGGFYRLVPAPKA